MHQLRTVEPTFVDSAPKRYVFETIVAAAPTEVFRALSADPSTWTEWFPTVTDGGYEGAPPHGVGTRRWVKATATRFRETVVEWDEPTTFTWRVDEASRAVASALVERWTVERAGAGSRVRWTFAIEPRLLFRLLVPAPAISMKPVFTRAMRNLEARLGQAANGAAGPGTPRRRRRRG